MAFRTECDWSIRLQRDETALHEIQLRLYDLHSALASSVNQILSLDMDGVYRNPQGHADGRTVHVDQASLSSRIGSRFSLHLRQLQSLASQPVTVVVSFSQDAALNALGPIQFYLLDFHGWNPAAQSSKVVVHLPQLSFVQRAVHWIWAKLGRSAYPIWPFHTGTLAIRSSVDSSARKVEYITGGKVIPGSGVAFASRLSISLLAGLFWVAMTLITAVVGTLAATKLAEMW